MSGSRGRQRDYDGLEVEGMHPASLSFRMQEQEILNQRLSEIQKLEQNRHLEDPDPNSRLRHLGLTVSNIQTLAKRRPDLQIKPDKTLGKGGFGTVYKGSIMTPDGKQKVAIKVCRIGRQGEGTLLSMLCHEARVWDHLKGCDFLCQLLDRVVVGQDVWFVVELADSGTVLSLIRQQEKKRLELNLARYLFKQVVIGINFMHGRGIAHRDIKAENILLFSSGDSPFGLIAKVADFGLTTIGWTPRSGIVRKNNQCGTRTYMAPEILFLSYMKVWNELPDNQTIYTEQISWTRDPGHASHASDEIPGVSVPKVMGHRDYKDQEWTNPLTCDYYALGVLLFVMVAGKYPRHKVRRHDYSAGLDYLMAGKVIKFSFMPQSCREFIRSMLEPDPVKRATIKCILNHDWMRDNPPTRSQRKRPEDLKLPHDQIRRPEGQHQRAGVTQQPVGQSSSSPDVRPVQAVRSKEAPVVEFHAPPDSMSSSTPVRTSDLGAAQKKKSSGSSFSVRFEDSAGEGQPASASVPSLSMTSSSSETKSAPRQTTRPKRTPVVEVHAQAESTTPSTSLGTSDFEAAPKHSSPSSLSVRFENSESEGQQVEAPVDSLSTSTSSESGNPIATKSAPPFVRHKSPSGSHGATSNKTI